MNNIEAIPIIDEITLRKITEPEEISIVFLELLLQSR